MGLSWSFHTSPCWMTWSPQISLVAALPIASIPGELPLNPCWFCGGACGPGVTREHALQAACCGPSAARRQPGGVEEASGGKVLVCKSAIPNPIPLGFCPGSRFYRSLLSLIGLPGPRCQRQRDGVEPDFFLIFFPNPYCQEPHLLNCCGGGGKAEAQDHAHAAHPSW